MYPLLTQSLGSISVKPVIVFGLITDAQSTTPSLGRDNGASVLCLDKVGTSEFIQPVNSILLKKMHLSMLRCRYLPTETKQFPAVYAAKPNYPGSKPDNKEEESEVKNTET
ncbi:hypothetical protein GBF38_002279 [Nibea albiflora]|uniref:Uncharacterized protein n=1 Tax=Nibea albiflora TaxID=240163 RepID=A0ACB7EDR3_NIBAL|nr:hypothetical protein GBF38_002279 [Nibea albiflora]